MANEKEYYWNYTAYGASGPVGTKYFTGTKSEMRKVGIMWLKHHKEINYLRLVYTSAPTSKTSWKVGDMPVAKPKDYGMLSAMYHENTLFTPGHIEYILDDDGKIISKGKVSFGIGERY